jgi:hypothetical protein
MPMTAAEFKKKWSRYQGKETSAYQSHFDDLCRLLGDSQTAWLSLSPLRDIRSSERRFWRKTSCLSAVTWRLTTRPRQISRCNAG